MGKEISRMHRVTLIATGRFLALSISLFGLVGPAAAQKATQAQTNAIRQACRGDYQTYCSSVPTGGSAALACLQQNAQSLSAPCQQAVGAVGGSASATGIPKPAAAPAAPASRTPAPPMSPRQEAALLRRSCGPDYQAYCGDVPPGGGRIIECLRANGPSLSHQCRTALMSARQGR
jgi:hypothetical protein